MSTNDKSVYIPDNPQNTIMMDCLNDYKDEMLEGQTENLKGLEEIYNLFEDSELTEFEVSKAREIINDIITEKQNIHEK